MRQSARSRRRAEKAIAEGRIPGRPGAKAKYTEEERKAVLSARDKAYREKNREELRVKRKASYDLRHSQEVVVPKKHGRPLKYLTPEALRQAERAKTRRYWLRNQEKCRAEVRAAAKKRKAARAIAEGRTPGLIGNPKRYATQYEREIARREYIERWRIETAEHRRQWGKQYHDTHRNEAAVKRHRRRARKINAGGSFSAADIAYLFELQKGNCPFCLKPLMEKAYHVDHYVPLAKGGTNDRSNLRLLHKKCNLSKGARDPAEHALQNGLLCW